MQDEENLPLKEEVGERQLQSTPQEACGGKLNLPTYLPGCHMTLPSRRHRNPLKEFRLPFD